MHTQVYLTKSEFAKSASKRLFGLCLLMPQWLLAADESLPSPSSSLFKMLIGLAVVLLILAAISWILKKVMPHANGQQSVIKVIGGVSVGSREKVVVLEISNRWIVVGVAAGQVSSIANLEVGNTIDSLAPHDLSMQDIKQTVLPTFAQKLKQSVAKFSEKKNA